MIRRPPRSTLDRSSAASDVYKRQELAGIEKVYKRGTPGEVAVLRGATLEVKRGEVVALSLIHISEPTRPY